MTGGGYTLADCEEEWYGGMMSRKLVPGVTYDLPDGGKLEVDADGNYRVNDKDAVVTYRSNRNRDFSPHINASDMLGDFLKYVASLGVRREDALGLPIKLFISWLVIEAATRDGDPIDIPPIPKDPLLLSAVRPRCIDCGRYIPRLHQRHGFPFCDPQHARRKLARN